jgi:hypothetical protein
VAVLDGDEGALEAAQRQQRLGVAGLEVARDPLEVAQRPQAERRRHGQEDRDDHQREDDALP